MSLFLHLLNPHSRLDSPIHRLAARIKLAAALAIIAATLLCPPTAASFLLIPAGLLVMVAALSRIPPLFILRRLLLLEPLVLGVALLSLLQPNGGQIFVLLATRSTLCLLTMILLSNTTPFSALLGIMRACRIPALLITTLALLYRYLFVLAEEAERMTRARASRTFVPRHRRNWRTSASVASQLFIRATERAQRVYSAMCSRGWQ